MRSTKKHFDLFRTEFLKWIDTYGITDYHFDFRWAEIEEGYAFVMGDYGQRSLLVSFTKDFDVEKISDEHIKYIAFHEASECLLHRMLSLAHARSFSPDEIDAETHCIINRLERVLYKGKKYEIE